MLVILDGWGWREASADNAVRLARTPTFSKLWSTCPHALLHTAGKDVGLPSGQMGNSEVGHLNIGAGRVVMQDLPRINQAVDTGEIAKAPALLGLIERLRKSGGTCHLMGLVSPGGVHSHQDHAAALAKVLAQAGVPTVVHVFTDGRDTPPQSADGCVRRLASMLPSGVSIGTVCGRYYAMDRDNRWDRVSKAYHAIVDAEGPRFADAQAAIADAYAHDVTDEFVVPAVVGNYSGVRDGDGLLCFNFRADRVREILAALLDPAFSGFPRPRIAHFAAATGMTQYSEHLDKLLQTIFPPLTLPNVLGEVVANAGRTQLRTAETEKYAHVTYFFNGGSETPYAGEDRCWCLRRGRDHVRPRPEMASPRRGRRPSPPSAGQVRPHRRQLRQSRHGRAHGQAGSRNRGRRDGGPGLGAIVAPCARWAARSRDGRSRQLRDDARPETGGPHTAHTINPVPVVLVGGSGVSLAEGRLADIAPTLLELMGLPKPPEMTGTSLIRRAHG